MTDAIDQSPTLADMAGRLSARFNFQCLPCNRFEACDAADLLARYGREITLANLTKRVRCKRCGMPVDGDFRIFRFYSVDTLEGFGRRVE